MRQIVIGGNEYLIHSRSLQVNKRINERTTCSFEVVEPAVPVEVGSDVLVSDETGVLFAGTVESVTEYDHKIPSTAVSCVDYSQLADKRIFADTFTNIQAGDIVRGIIDDVLSAEGITEGDVQPGPVIAAAVFPYENCNLALNKLAELASYSWEIDTSKRLHFFDRSTYRSPYDLNDDSQNYSDLRVKRTRGMYRNRQYIQAGMDLTSPIPLERPTPRPDGVSQTFVLRFPVGAKPQIFRDGSEVDPDTIGIGGLEQGKAWYWNKGKNTFYQDEAGSPLTSEDLQVTYRGLFPILLVADDPGEINDRQAAEGGTGIHEALIQEPNIDSQAAAMDFARGKLEKYGYIPQVVTWTTYEPGLQPGQLIRIDSTVRGLADDFLIEAVSLRDEGHIIRYDVKALDGSAIGGWEQFFKSLLQGNRQLVIRENEVLIRLNTVSEIAGWSESVEVNVFACPVPADDLYPSEELIPC